MTFRFFGIALLLLFFYACTDSDKKTENQRPNVLLICVDDLRPDLGCYGNDLIVSPNIDKLASEGCLFMRHYVQSAICGPSRSTLLTGKLQQGWDLWGDLRKGGVEPEKTIALPHHFKRNGYAHNTAMRIGIETPRLPYETENVEDIGYADGKWYDEAYVLLMEIGDWMKVNGEAIYGTCALAPYKDGKVCLTRKKNGAVYAIYLPDENETTLPSKVWLNSIQARQGSGVELLGHGRVKWEKSGNGMLIHVPKKAIDDPPGKEAWTFKIETKNHGQ